MLLHGGTTGPPRNVYEDPGCIDAPRGGSTALPCPNCGAELQFIEEYGRQYCYGCGQYAPEGYGGGKGLSCPTCGGVLTYVKDYDRYFCYKDQEYAPEDLGGEPAPPGEPGPPDDLPSIDDVLPEPPAPEASGSSSVAEEPPPGPAAGPAPAAAPASEPASPPVPESAAPVPEPVRESAPQAPEPPPSIHEEVPSAPEVPSPSPRVEEELAPDELAKEKQEKAEKERWRPSLVREEISKMKKAALMDLAAAYDLETMGTKEEIKERLLEQLKGIEREEREKVEARTPAEIPTPSPAVPEPASEPAPTSAPDPSAPAVDIEPDARPLGVEPPVEPVAAPEEMALRSPEPAPPGEPVPSAAPAAGDSPFVDAPGPVPDAPTAAPLDVATPIASAPAPVPGPSVPEEPRVINPCPTCGQELTYITRYDRYYCYRCKTYAPPVVKVETVPAPPRIGKPCPTCGGELTYIAEYGREYCYTCKRYAPLAKPSDLPTPPAPGPAETPRPPAPAVEIVPVRNPCPTCGRELTFIAKYGRYYCYPEKKYAPLRPKPACPTCGKDLTFVAQYQRHYCHSCGQYAPMDLTRRILAERSAQALATAAARPVAATAGAARVVPGHRHGSPGAGVGIAALGLLLVLAQQVLFAMPVALGSPPYVTASPAVVWVLGFLGLLLIGLGALVGLVQVRTQK